MNLLQTIDLKKYYDSELNIIYTLLTKPMIILAKEPVGSLDFKTCAKNYRIGGSRL